MLLRSATHATPRAHRRRGNRKLRQRRPLRARLPSPRALADAAGRGLLRALPLLAALAAGAGLAVGARAGWAFARSSPRFAVHEVVVRGNERVPADAVRRLSGVRAGDNLFRLSLADVEARVAADPWIAEASAARELPHRLLVEVVERRPAAVVLLGGPYLVDAGGRPFKRARLPDEAAGLPLVTGLDRGAFAADPDSGAAAVRTALAVLERWHARRDRPRVGEVRVERSGLTLYTTDGAVAVRLGPEAEDDPEARFERFDVVWAALTPGERRAARAVHLDSPTRPDRITIRLAERQTWQRRSGTN